MKHALNLSDVDNKFEEKVYVIADEVLNILKELSREHKQRISSKLIAERMFSKDSVKNILNDHGNEVSQGVEEADYLKELSNLILDKSTEVVPPSVNEKISDIKEQLHNKEIVGGSQERLESPINVVKGYINSISTRNRDLEEFMQQTMQYLTETEVHIAGELDSHHQKFRDDREFEENISTNMNEIRQECDTSAGFSSLKTAVFGRIESINKRIAHKRERDVQLLKDTEKTIEKMSNKMIDMKQEADEIRRRSEEIEFDSIRDALTGLYNRKAYDEKITETLANVGRYNAPASLMICDIDFFKKINDNFGHKVGDLALKKLASLLKERLRINDFISRYGGEEFAIILPYTDLEGTIKAGEGIRSYINNSVFTYKEQKIPLTVSIGVSSFRKGEDGDSVFERADNALYLAKRSGRNQVKSEKDVQSEGAVLNKEVLKI